MIARKEEEMGVDLLAMLPGKSGKKMLVGDDREVAFSPRLTTSVREHRRTTSDSHN